MHSIKHSLQQATVGMHKITDYFLKGWTELACGQYTSSKIASMLRTSTVKSLKNRLDLEYFVISLYQSVPNTVILFAFRTNMGLDSKSL